MSEGGREREHADARTQRIRTHARTRTYTVRAGAFVPARALADDGVKGDGGHGDLARDARKRRLCSLCCPAAQGLNPRPQTLSAGSRYVKVNAPLECPRSRHYVPRTHFRSPAVPLARLRAMNVFECRGGKKSKVSPRGALNLPAAR